MRAGLLFQESLYADARRELVKAISASPEEATLHLLLGHVYDRTGLRQLAASEFDEAEALSAPKP
jgi:Flp pilus assembly protein TadD